MVGVPAAADIELLVRFLQHLGNFRIAFALLEKAVEVNRAPALGKGDMRFGGQFLVAEKQRAMVEKGLTDLCKFPIIQPRHIDIFDDRADRVTGFGNLHIALRSEPAHTGTDFMLV